MKSLEIKEESVSKSIKRKNEVLPDPEYLHPKDRVRKTSHRVDLKVGRISRGSNFVHDWMTELLVKADGEVDEGLKALSRKILKGKKR